MSDDTKLTHAGRHPDDNYGVVNPPVYHASTILFPTLKDLRNFNSAKVTYGRHGTPGTFALNDAMCALENADYCLLASSGMQAITTAMLSFLKAGDHVLMVDTVYTPTRIFCDRALSPLGIETTYYDPLIGSDIQSLMRPNTRMVFTESPGSLTFEMQDIPAIVQAAKSYPQSNQEVLVAIDNTWATPLFYKPLDHGVDLSIQAVTKYIAGHADAMLGTVCCKSHLSQDLENMRRYLGLSVGPDDVYLALRGLRTLSVRLERHQKNALIIADWLAKHDLVDRVFYPALAGDAGHAIWRRDFTGACGLFGFSLNSGTDNQMEAMLDSMQLFGMGFSWGGYESLLIPIMLAGSRTATQWNPAGPCFRIHVGLEDPDDLISDLEAGFERFRKGQS